ncbi:hypothetical protein [Lederbergia lenta]|uniref:hypothetical protein n=1 Tax=Lederbergia lenta TaxID=1467 RepID=UPI00203D948D|nr:hypothetical protein [Lederbergia lenta]MCM3113142.1 hypothetical protein [Lederbergia lenta]
MLNTLYLKIWKNKLIHQLRKNPIFIVFPILFITIITIASIKITNENILMIKEVGDNLVVNQILSQSLLASNLFSLMIALLLFFIFKNNFNRSNLLRILPMANYQLLMIELIPFICLIMGFVCAVYTPTYIYLFIQSMNEYILLDFLFLTIFLLMNCNAIFFSFINVYFFNNMSEFIAHKLRKEYLHEPLFFSMIIGCGYIYYQILKETNFYGIATKNIFVEGDTLATLFNCLPIILLSVIILFLFYIISFIQKKPLQNGSTAFLFIPFSKFFPLNVVVLEFKRVVRDYHRVLTIYFLFLCLLLLNWVALKNPENNELLMISQFIPMFVIEIVILLPLVANSRDYKKENLIYLLPTKYDYFIIIKMTFYLVLSLLLAGTYFILHSLFGLDQSAIHLVLFIEISLFTILAFLVGTFLPSDKNSGLQEGLGLILLFILYFTLTYTMNSLGIYEIKYLVMLCFFLFILSPIVIKRVSVGVHK